MFSATHFSYDGVYSGVYGLQIASFNSQSVETTSVFAPTVQSVKSAFGERFFISGAKVEQPPEYQFQIISEDFIDDVNRRKIITWLSKRNSYKKLKIFQRDLESYYYRCIFTVINPIYVNGRCHGFEVTARFDSEYAYGAKTIQTITASSDGTIGSIINHSDALDRLVYPKIIITTPSDYTGENITIQNTTIDGIPLILYGKEGNKNNGTQVIDASKTIVIDGELKKFYEIQNGSNISPTALYLSNCNKQWIGLKNGSNTIKVTCEKPVTVTVECQSYVLIGF